jgi:Ca-activated chloride channel family protein
VFAFGIGSSVNRYLIEGLARAGQGEPFVVTEPQAAAATAGRFKSYIETPVLTGIDIHFDGFDTYAVEPIRPADLFARRPLVVCGKWRGRPVGAIRLTGNTGGGPYEARFDVSGTVPAGDDSALPYLWARMRLGRLTDFTSREDDAETREQVTRLGLRYNLLTAHTSFVAVHQKVRNTTAPAQDVAQPLPLPRHVSNLAVGGRNVPEPRLGLLLAVTAAAGLVMVLRRRRSSYESS